MAENMEQPPKTLRDLLDDIKEKTGIATDDELITRAVKFMDKALGEDDGLVDGA